MLAIGLRFEADMVRMRLVRGVDDVTESDCSSCLIEQEELPPHTR